MVRAWFMDSDKISDQRLEHHKNPPKFVTIEELKKLSGVEYFNVSFILVNIYFETMLYLEILNMVYWNRNSVDESNFYLI